MAARMYLVFRALSSRELPCNKPTACLSNASSRILSYQYEGFTRGTPPTISIFYKLLDIERAEFTRRAFLRPLPGAIPHRLGKGCPWSMPSLRAIT